MHKRSTTFLHRRNAMFLGPLAIVGVTLLIAWAGLASASSTRTEGTVHYYEADTAWAGNVGTAILTGAITDHGIDHQGVAGNGKINRIALSKGSFEVNATALDKKATTIPFDPKTCATAGTVTAQAPIVKGTGTGAYRGIHGTFKTTVSVAGIDPRLKNHQCNTNAKHFPGVLVVKANGTVSYK